MTKEEMIAKYGQPTTAAPAAKAVDTSSLEARWLNPAPETKERNLGQKALGLVVDPLVKGSALVGQTIGTGLIKGASKIFQDEAGQAETDRKLKIARETPQTAPFTGTPIKAPADVTAKDVGADVLGTVALGLGPVAGGAALGASAALESDKGVAGTALDTAIGALGGKILDVGVRAAMPFIEKAVLKYGSPVLEKLKPYLPEASKADIEALSKRAQEAVAKTAQEKGVKESSVIQELISPKITSKETRKIIEEGRLTRSKDSAIWGKKPDIIAQAEEVQRAGDTILKNIPGAAKMNDAQLSTAVNNEITKTAKALQGEMKTVVIKPDTTGRVIDNWKKLKAKQQSTPEFIDNQAGNIRFQEQFENHLKKLEWDITSPTGKFKKPSPKTLDDLWESRKSYDASIPERVKKATSASSPQDQVRKEMWLDNRALLNHAINDTVSGLGKESQEAFAKMADMYMANENILAKAKIDLRGEKSTLPTSKKDIIKWLSIGGGGVTVWNMLTK